MSPVTAPIWETAPNFNYRNEGTTPVYQPSPEASPTIVFKLEKKRSTNDVVCHIFIGRESPSLRTTSTRLDSEASKELIQRISSFGKYQSNWDGYLGESASQETIKDAITLIKKFSDKHLPTRTGLSNDGEISLIWDRKDLFADFGVIGDGAFTYFIKHKNQKLYGDDIPLTESIPSTVLELLGN